MNETKTMAQLVPAALAGLTETKEPSTTGKPISIETWERWAGFKTLGDQTLEQMLIQTAKFLLDIRNKKAARWLTLAGSSGCGKTMLAKRLYRAVNVSGFFKTTVIDNDFSYPSDFIYWPRSAVKLQQGEHPEELHHAQRVKFLVLDDIGATRDSTGYVTGHLGNLLGERVGRWTVVTSNLGVEQIAEKLDTRVASRLIRDENTVVQIECLDYALRSK
jgi:DNA replication protein DnaC